MAKALRLLIHPFARDRGAFSILRDHLDAGVQRFHQLHIRADSFAPPKIEVATDIDVTVSEQQHRCVIASID